MLKGKIISMFFLEHLKVNEISKQLKVSSSYITKVIKKDERYAIEKENRKNISKIARKESQKIFAKNKREIKRIEDNYSFVLLQHAQASSELSKTKHLSDESYRKWNYSAYRYNPSKNRYEFRESLGRSADVPKYIKGW